MVRMILVTQVVIAFAVLGIGGFIAYSWLSEHSRVDRYLSNTCPFFYSVAIVPVTDSTTDLGFNIVEGGRKALVGQNCPERLPPASPTLLYLGRKYGVPVPY
jgi:hypothetical protein